jgi:hypothetical protein
MKKIIYLITILSTILVGCEDPCIPNPNGVSYIKMGLKDTQGVHYIRVEGPKDFSILYGDLVQYKCANSRSYYEGVAVDVNYFSLITEEEYNKHNGLTNPETTQLDTTLPY